MTGNYKVVCICGSMKFYDWMLQVAERETLKGNIVLMPFVRKDKAMNPGNLDLQHRIEQELPDGKNIGHMLDEMHRAKIDMSSEIIVCSNNIGYVGESTAGEIRYAIDHLKPINWALDPSSPNPDEDSDDYK